ncbi:hypothetical protein IWW36_000070 [Coemansia brasiliensis]|uniref:Uncharacterized protein n=1 Tax=Coemansia brasiliensis TaxID=2650707 RepID=A0A9W8IKG4_9FUNG|nr:hypothetical protein IWW36_000070 [Coemansia brasiliensis]
MEAELKWLLETSIPENIQLVRDYLSKVTFVSYNDTSKPSSQASLLSKSDSEVNGTATVLGTRVTQLSLTLPLLNPSSQGISTTIYLKRGDSLALSQAQDAQSYLKSVLCKVLPLDTREDALAFKFAPSLPENMVVECRLKGPTLMVHVYWLKFRRDAKSAGILDAFTKEQSTGHTLVYNGRLAEVKKEVVYEADLEDLDRNLSYLDRAAGVCIDMVGQIHAFDSF